MTALIVVLGLIAGGLIWLAFLALHGNATALASVVGAVIVVFSAVAGTLAMNHGDNGTERE